MGIEKGGINVANLVNGTDRLENRLTNTIDAIENLIETAQKANNTNLKIKMDLSAVDKGSKALEKYNKLLITTKRNGEIKVNSNVRSKTNNYYKSQERAEKDLIEKWNKYVTDANNGLYDFGAYSKDDGSKDKANDIYRYANAFEALGGDLSKVNPRLKEFVETLRTTKLTTDPNNDYTVEKFKEVFSLLDDLRKEGAISIDDSFAPLTESLPKAIDLLDSVVEKAKQAKKETSTVPSTGGRNREEESEHKEIPRKTRAQVEKELRAKYKGNADDSYADADYIIKWNTSDEISDKSGIAKYVAGLEELKERAKDQIDEVLRYENELIDIQNGKTITSWRGEAKTEDEVSETLERKKRDYKEYLDYIEVIQNKINELATTPVENDGSVLSKQVETISAQLSVLNERIDSIRKSFQDIDLSKLSNETKDIGNFSLTEEQIKSLSDLFDGLKKEITEIKNAFGTIDDESGFKPMLSSISDISESLLGLKSVFVDVGEGQEFSPLLSMINEITEAVKKLEQAVSKIKLNINLDANMVDEAGLMKVQGRKQDLLRAYKERFSAMKSYKIDNSKVVSSMFGQKNNALINDLNKSILEFDESIYDNIDQKIKAYESIINRMIQVAKETYGEDVYDNMDSRYKKNITTAKGNLSRAVNSMGKNSQDEIGDLFGKTDLTNVEAQLKAISASLDKIVIAAEKFKEAFNVNVEFDKIGASFKEEQNAVDGAVTSEKTTLETLEQKIKDVTTAVDAKTTAFTQEKIAVETAVNYEKAKLDELIEKIKEVAQFISELGDKPIDIKIDEKTEEVLSRLKTTLDGDWSSDLTTLSQVLSGLNIGENTVERMQQLANVVLTLKSNLNNLSDGGVNFLSSINQLITEANGLKDLATVLKATKQQIDNAKKATGQDKSIVSSEHFDANVASMRDSAIESLSEKYSDVRMAEITRSEKGIVTLTAAIKDADGTWKKFTGNINSEGKLSTSGITELTKSKVNELKEIENITSKMTQQANVEIMSSVGVKPMTAEWNEAVLALGSYKDELGEVQDITMQMQKNRITGEEMISYTVKGNNGNSMIVGANGDVLKANIAVSKEATDKKGWEQASDRSYDREIGYLKEINKLKIANLEADEAARAGNDEWISFWKKRLDFEKQYRKDMDLERDEGKSRLANESGVLDEKYETAKKASEAKKIARENKKNEDSNKKQSRIQQNRDMEVYEEEGKRKLQERKDYYAGLIEASNEYVEAIKNEAKAKTDTDKQIAKFEKDRAKAKMDAEMDDIKASGIKRDYDKELDIERKITKAQEEASKTRVRLAEDENKKIEKIQQKRDIEEADSKAAFSKKEQADYYDALIKYSKEYADAIVKEDKAKQNLYKTEMKALRADMEANGIKIDPDKEFKIQQNLLNAKDKRNENRRKEQEKATAKESIDLYNKEVSLLKEINKLKIANFGADKSKRKANWSRIADLEKEVKSVDKQRQKYSTYQDEELEINKIKQDLKKERDRELKAWAKGDAVKSIQEETDSSYEAQIKYLERVNKLEIQALTASDAKKAAIQEEIDLYKKRAQEQEDFRKKNLLTDAEWEKELTKKKTELDENLQSAKTGTQKSKAVEDAEQNRKDREKLSEESYNREVKLLQQINDLKIANLKADKASQAVNDAEIAKLEGRLKAEQQDRQKNNLVTMEGDALIAKTQARLKQDYDTAQTGRSNYDQIKQDEKDQEELTKQVYDEQIRCLEEINRLRIENKNASASTVDDNNDEIQALEKTITLLEQYKATYGLISAEEEKRVTKAKERLQKEYDKSSSKQFTDWVKEAKDNEVELQALYAKMDSDVLTSGEEERLNQLIAYQDQLIEKIENATNLTKAEQKELDEYYKLAQSQSEREKQQMKYSSMDMDSRRQSSSIKNAEDAFSTISSRGIAGLNDHIDRARQSLNDLNAEFIRGDKDVEQYEKAVENLIADLNSIKAVVGKNLTDSQGQNAMNDYIESYVQSVSGTKLKSSKAKISKDGKTLEISSEFLDANKNAVKLLTTLNLLNGELRQTQEIGGKGNLLSKMFEGWKQGLSNVARYISSFVGFYEIFNAIKQGAQTVIEFDTALTEMRKVSDETVSSLKNFQSESFDLADGVGTTALQIQQSTADFMRLGETLDEASKSAETANILLNVSEFESIDEATTSLIAMKSAFDDIDQMSIVDKLNQIGNNFAISTDGLASALQRSASALKTAGNDIDEAIALTTAGNAVVQDPEAVGAGLRTIALRLTGTKEAKAELEELGEETDGVVTTTSKLRDTILAATKVESNDFKGFDILDDNGNFKSTYEILLGIAQIYEEIVESDKELGDNKANLLLETIAGKNRSNIAASILQSPETLEAAYNDSKFNSENSAQDELNKYLESLEGKIQKFKNALQELASTSIDSGFLGGLIDTGTKLINILDALIEKIGVLPTLFGGFTAFTLGKKGLMKIGAIEEEKTLLDPVINWLKNYFSNSDIEEVVEQATEAGREAAENIVDNVTDSMAEGVSENVARSARENIEETVTEGVAESTGEVVPDMVRNMMEQTAGESTESSNENIGEAVENVIENALDEASEGMAESASRNIGESITDGITEGITESAEETVGNAVENVIDNALENATENARDRLLSASDFFDDTDDDEYELDEAERERNRRMFERKDNERMLTPEEELAEFLNMGSDTGRDIGENLTDGIQEAFSESSEDMMEELFEEDTESTAESFGQRILNKLKDIFSSSSDDVTDELFTDGLDSAGEDIGEELFDGIRETFSESSEDIMDELFEEGAESATRSGGAFSSLGEVFSGVGAKLSGIVKLIPKLAKLGIAAAAVVAVIKGIQWAYDQTFSQVDKRADEVIDKFNQAKAKVESDNSTVQSLSSRYEELSKGVSYSGQNVALTTEEFKEYQDICNQIAEIYPSLVESYDAQGNAILNLKGNVEGLTEAYKKAQQEAYNTLITADDVDDVVEKFNMTSETNFWGELFDMWDNDVGDGISHTDAIEQLKLFRSKTNEELKNIFNWETVDGYEMSDEDSSIFYSDFLSKALGLEVGMSDDDIAKARQKANEKIKECEAVLEESRAQILNLAEAYLKVDGTFFDEDTSFQNMISTLLNNMSYEDVQKYISGEDGEATKAEVNAFADSLLNMSEEAKKKLGEAYDLANEFDKDSNVKAYVNKMQYIQNALAKEGVEIPINFLFDDEKEITETLRNNIKEISGGDIGQLGELNSFISISGIDTVEEIDFFNKVTVGAENASEAIERYDDAINKIKREKETKVKDAFLQSTVSDKNKDIINNDAIRNAYRELQSVASEAQELGVDINTTVFGNIDTNNRQILEWTEANLSKYEEAIKSWDATANELKGSHSTIFGSSAEFDGIEIAFSPMLQTENGAELLTSDTVYSYIDTLIGEASKDGSWTNEELFALDAKGLEVDGKHIQGLIADIGDTAKATAEAMHFTGKDGAIAESRKELERIAKEQNKTMGEILATYANAENSEDYKKLVSWYDSLPTEEDREIVYEIILEEKTSAWVFKDYIHEFARVKAGAVEAEEAMSKLFTPTGESGSFYTSTIQPYVEGIMSLKDALTKVRGGNLSKTDMLALFEKFPSLAGKSEDLESAIESLMEEMNGDISDEFENKINTLGEEAGLTKKELEELRDIILGMNGALDLEEEKEVMQNFYTALNESATSTGLSSTSIGNIKDMVAEVVSAGKDYDPSGLFEQTANGIHLNVAKLRDLQGQYISLKKENVDGYLEDLKTRYKNLSDELTNGNLSPEDKITTIDELKALRKQIEDTATLASQYDGLTSAFYRWEQAQQTTNEGAKFDSMIGYKDTAQELYKEGRTNTDDFRSFVDLIAYEDMLTMSTKDIVAEYESWNKAIDNTSYSINSFLKDGGEGVNNFLGAMKELGYATKDADGNWDVNLTAAQMEELAQKTGTSVEFITSMLQKANEYGDWNIKFTSTDDLLAEIKTVEELELEASEARKALEELGVKPIEVNLEFKTVKDGETVIADIRKQMEGLDPNVATDAAQLEYLQSALELAVKRKIELERPIFLNVDSSTLSADLAPAYALIKEYQDAVDILKESQELGLDTTEAQAKVDELATKIQTEIVGTDVGKAIGFSDNASIEEITTKIANSELTFENVKVNKSKIEEQIDTIFVDGKEIAITINEEKLQEDYAAIELPDKEVGLIFKPEGSQPEETSSDQPSATATVAVNADPTNLEKVLAEKTEEINNTTATANIDANAAPAKSKTDSMVSYIESLTPEMILYGNTNPLRTEIDNALRGPHTINVRANILGLPKVDGTANVSGTAFANGTKHRQGDWRAGGSGGTALVGELGQELLVRDGHFFTIGDNSAEFIKYKPGDIIFNHEQTAEIFKHGHILKGNKRGKAYANGTVSASGKAFAGNNPYGASGGGGSIPTTSGTKKPQTGNNNGNNNNNNNNNNTTKTAEQTAETFDWIEIKIAELERAISRLERKANGAYNTFKTRNTALKNQIGKVTDEINLQEDAYRKYMNKANSVKFSEKEKKYRDKVLDGKLQIEDIKDEKLREKINEYKQWAEKAKACKDKIDELKDTEKQLYQQRFDMISTEYDSILGIKDERKNTIESYAELAETKGYAPSTKYAEELKGIEQARKTDLQNQRKKMQAELDRQVRDGIIEVGSESYNTMVAEIQAVDTEIVNTQNNIANLDNEIRQIGWDNFDKARDKISAVANEADFLIKLMSGEDMFDEDTGKITDAGMATLGMHNANYELYLSEVSKYKDEIAEIDKALKKNPYDQNLINRKQELIEKQQESALAAKTERDAMIDLAEQGINAHLAAMKELIDSYTEALDSQKDLYDYQKKVSKQTQDIAKLEKRLAAYRNDNSEEGRAKYQKLQNELSEAKESLKETEADRALSNQKELLNKMYEQYDKILHDKLKNTDKLIAEVSSAINKNSSSIITTLTNTATSFGTTVSTAIQSIVTNKDGVKDGVKDVQKNTEDNIDKQEDKADYVAETNINKVKKTDTHNTTVANETKKKKEEDKKNQKKDTSFLKKLPKNKRVSAKNKKKLNINTSIIDRLKYFDFQNDKTIRATYYGKMGLGKKKDYKGTAAQNKAMINWLKKHGYRKGVYNLKEDQYAFTQEVAPEAIVRKDGSVLMPLTAGSSVLNGNATKNFYDFMNNPLQYMNDIMNGQIKSSVPNQSKSNVTIESNIQLTMSLPGITNYEEFKSKMVRDKDFEKRIQAMSVDLLTGRSALSKHKR